jgi:CRP-like cAMP-binding protein
MCNYEKPLQQLFAVLSQSRPFDEGLEDQVRSLIRHKLFKKGSFILREGAVSRYMYFIVSGLARCYYNDGMHETTYWFMKANDLMMGVQSFYRQVPSSASIIAMEDTEVLYLDITSLEMLYERFPGFNVNRATLTEYYYCLSEERYEILSKRDAMQRYEYFLRTFPGLELRIDAEDVASFIQVTPTYLSKLKARRRNINKR